MCPRVLFSETRIVNILTVFKKINILSFIIFHLDFINFWAAQYSDMQRKLKHFYSKVHICISSGNVLCSRIMHKYYIFNIVLQTE
jgi:hypothetical protein